MGSTYTLDTRGAAHDTLIMRCTMSLAERLQDAVLDSRRPLADALRLAKVLAAELESEELANWVDWELKGYPQEHADMPAYRRIPSTALAVISNGYYTHTAQQLPTYRLPDWMQKHATEANCNQSVGELEALATQRSDVVIQWASELVALANQHVSLSETYQIMSVQVPVPKPAILGVLESVRNNLLDYLLRLKQIDSTKVEDDKELSRLDKKKVRNAFKFTIGGNDNTVAAGETVTQQIANAVPKGDSAALEDRLDELGVSKNDSKELQIAVEDDKKKSPKTIGERTKAVIERISTAAGNKLAEGGAGLILEAVRQFLGL